MTTVQNKQQSNACSVLTVHTHTFTLVWKGDAKEQHKIMYKG